MLTKESFDLILWMSLNRIMNNIENIETILQVIPRKRKPGRVRIIFILATCVKMPFNANKISMVLLIKVVLKRLRLFRI